MATFQIVNTSKLYGRLREFADKEGIGDEERQRRQALRSKVLKLLVGTAGLNFVCTTVNVAYFAARYNVS